MSATSSDNDVISGRACWLIVRREKSRSCRACRGGGAYDPLQSNLHPFTLHTLASRRAQRQAQKVEAQGLRHAFEEYCHGDLSVAAPILDASGAAFGAINIGRPAQPVHVRGSGRAVCPRCNCCRHSIRCQRCSSISRFDIISYPPSIRIGSRSGQVLVLRVGHIRYDLDTSVEGRRRRYPSGGWKSGELVARHWFETYGRMARTGAPPWKRSHLLVDGRRGCFCSISNRRLSRRICCLAVESGKKALKILTNASTHHIRGPSPTCSVSRLPMAGMSRVSAERSIPKCGRLREWRQRSRLGVERRS